MIYLYAITDRPEAPLPARDGLDEASLLRRTCQDIAAVVSPIARAEVPPEEANIWRHEAVVDALMADRIVLPVRFGTIFPDETAVQAVLAEHYADLVADLGQVRGHVELGLRVLWDDNDGQSPPLTEKYLSPVSGSEQPPANGSGRAYLMARIAAERQDQARRERAEVLAAEPHAALARLATESTYQVLVTPRMLLTASYLVQGDRGAAFRQEVDALSAAYPAWCFLCTGPWPPYSFVTAGVPMVRRGGEEGCPHYLTMSS